MHAAWQRLSAAQARSSACATKIREARDRRDLVAVDQLLREFDDIQKAWNAAHDEYQQVANVVKKMLDDSAE